MIVEQVDHFGGFRCLKTAWEALYRADPEAQYFLSWTWLSGVLQTYPGQWVVLVARDAEGQYLGFLPLRRKTVWSKSRERLRNEIEFAGRLFWADYGGVLCSPAHEAPVLQALASHVKQMNWSHFYLKGFRTSDRRYDMFMQALEDDRLTTESLTATINEGETDNLVCPYIDLPDTFEAYLSDQLSSNTRQKIRRFMRKVDSSSDYRISTTTTETRESDLPILERLWREMWAPVKGDKAARLAAMYRTIVARGLDSEGVQMIVLWHREAPVGVLASFLDREKSRLLFFVAGRDESFHEVPVGLVLHAYNIRWAIEYGIKTYDFLRGDEPYKHSLGASQTVRLKYALIRTRSGTNLNGRLDPGCLAEALRMADDFARREQAQAALTVFYQTLSAIAGQERAERLLDVLSDGT